MAGRNKSQLAIELTRLEFRVIIIRPVPIIHLFRKFIGKVKDENIEGVVIHHPAILYLPFRDRFKRLLTPVQQWLFRVSVGSHIKKYVHQGGKIIHAHSMLLAGSGINYYKKKLGVKTLVTFHDNEIQLLNTMPDWYRRFLRKQIQLTDTCIFVSRLLMQHCKSLLPEDSTPEVIPFPIDSLETTKKLPENFTIISCGRLIPTKGFDILIKAGHILIQKGLDLRIKIIGKGPEYHHLEKMIERLGLQKFIFLEGIRDNQDVLKEMAHAHLFVLPSYRESLGLVYLEAMSVQTPVVGIKGQGIEEYIQDGENGFLVEPKNFEQLANRIEGLIQDEGLRNKVGENGRKTYAESLAEVKNNATRHLNIYDRLLNE